MLRGTGRVAMSAVRPGLSVPVEFVGATEASTPASEMGDLGTGISISAAAATLAGDLLVACIGTSYNGTETWSTPGFLQADLGDLIILAGVAATDAPSFSWTSSGMPGGVARSAQMIALRNWGAITDTAHGDGVTTVPDLSSGKSGSALVAFAKGRTTLTTEVTWSPDSPMTLGQRHSGICSIAYCLNTHTASAYQVGLGAGTVSGRNFSWVGLGSPNVPEVYGVTVEPA